MMPLLLLIVLALLGTGGMAVIVAGRRLGRWAVYGAVLLATALLSILSLVHLLGGGEALQIALPLGLPGVGARFRVDALAAFFLVVVNLGGAAASLYGLGSAPHDPGAGRVLPFFALFVAAMNLVVVADDAFSFLFSWELMSLASWALVMARHDDPENAHAGLVYLVMASFGTLCLLVAFALLAAASGSFAFADIRAAAISPHLAALILTLALFGAGSKAGIVPLHVWLPLAHPAAPSHVSALMSGVMTKVAIYGFIRIMFELVGEPAWWWGALVLVLGGITALAGVLYALMQHDLKRLLAYHTVENIGIIFIGLGLALAFAANGLATGAALALTAALFHVFNHSLFKSLLFLGSGAVLSATGERDMEHLGGLIHRMPLTAFTFLIGSAAISALPPLNGFLSEWLTFQAILISPEMPQWILRLSIPAVGALLALSAALAATCFVKAFGITFLGRARTDAAAAAGEVGGFMLAPMVVLAALCVLVGIFGGFVIDAIAPVTAALIDGARLPKQAAQDWLTVVPISAPRSSYNGLIVLIFIALSAALIALLVTRLAPRGARRSAAWDCGFPEAGPAAQYTASSFAQPIRRIFGSVVFQARETVSMPPPGSMRPARLLLGLRDLPWEAIYQPLAALVWSAATRLNRLFLLTIRGYLTLVFATLIVLLLALALWQPLSS